MRLVRLVCFRPVIVTVVMLLLVTVVCFVTSLPASMNLPLVDPGLFVISGVKTCGNSSGYCLLGSDCTMDDDFLPDPTGDCKGLKRAFTPSAPFACCKLNKRSTGSPTVHDADDVGRSVVLVENEKSARNDGDGVMTFDASKMDVDQLAKLNQIESVVKKIVEQLIHETANGIKNGGAAINYAAETETVNAVRNETIDDGVPNDEDGTETNATVEPFTEVQETAVDGAKAETKTPSEDEETAETNVPDAIESESDESIDDEFKYEKHICQKTCKSEVVFTVDKKPTCYGTLLDDLWILTSGTCASRLNKAGIRKVNVSRKDLSSAAVLTISNILVHENFKSPASKNPPDNNDLALASLTVPLQSEAECIPCFNQKSNVTNEICKSFQNENLKNAIKSGENCEGRVQLRSLVGNSYLILPCNRWRMQYNQEGRLGSGLWCDGKLAGVQTGVGVGSLIYTPVNGYAEWISDNKRIEYRRR